MSARAIALACACALALGGTWAQACGPDLPYARFLVTDQPADDGAYARGRLGLLSANFSTANLVMAYRALRGLAPAESSLASPPGLGWGGPADAVAAWRAARESTHVAQRPDARWFYPADRALRRGDTYLFYANCQDDAFRNATRTLADRLHGEGGLTPAVRDWLAGQDSVFANCGYESTSVLPPPAPGGAPAWLVHDRAYQQAAARFYAGAFDDAAAAFGRIADDATSPYHALAAYLVARAHTRKGTLVGAAGAIDRAELLAARAQVERVLADPRLADVHAAARRLESFLDFRLDRPARLRDLSSALSAPTLARDARAQVVDFAKLNGWFRPTEVESLAARGTAGIDLADWIATVRAGADGATHAVARWRAEHGAEWLVAALLDARGSDPAAVELAVAATQLPRTSPAYETATIARLRLALERGETDQARALLDACLAADPGAWTRSTWNLLHAQRGLLARDLAAFLVDAPRVPARIDNLYVGSPAPDAGLDPARPLLDADGAFVLSECLPLAGLARLADGDALPVGLRGDVALAAWTRAVVLDLSPAEMARLTARLAQLRPGLDSSLAAYRGAATAEARRFEAAWLVLTHPGCDVRVRPGLGRLARLDARDIYGDQWWPAPDSLPVPPASFSQDAYTLAWPGGGQRALTELADRIVPAADRAQALRERAALRAAGPAPNWLCARVLAEVGRHPRDPRLPEALHRCVLATRYGVADARTRTWSRRAFDVLHARYGQTTWAKRTRYWY